MTDWLRPALVRRYGVDMSKALGIVAVLGVPGAMAVLAGDERYARHIVGGVSALLFGTMLWTRRVGAAAQRAESQDPRAIPEALAPEWWRPPFVQRHGLEIAKALGAAAIFFPCLAAVWTADGYNPYAVGLLYALLLGGTFWTITVGSEARRAAARLAAAQHAAMYAAAQGAQLGPPGSPTYPMSAQGFVGHQQPPKAAGVGTSIGKAVAAVGCGVAFLYALVLFVGFVALAWFCVMMLIGLGHGSPPSWLTPRWLF